MPRPLPELLGTAAALAAITREPFSMICPLEARPVWWLAGGEAGYRGGYQIRSEDYQPLRMRAWAGRS